MPTYEGTQRFLEEFDHLSPAARAAFRRAVGHLVDDLRRGCVRKGLRVKRVQGQLGVWEMTWADDGRALFTYGTSIRLGDPHVV